MTDENKKLFDQIKEDLDRQQKIADWSLAILLTLVFLATIWTHLK